MSLDVYLIGEQKTVKSGSGIFIRENGETKEISEAEWNEKHPNQEPCRVVSESEETDIIYDANITHNLNTMADKAGIYEALWRPETIGAVYAKDIIERLENGLQKLKAQPIYFKQFNPENGWGNYEGLIRFAENYLDACKNNPDAKIQVSR